MPVNRSREVKPIHRGHKHDAAHSIDFYAYESRLRSWNAGLKMAVEMCIRDRGWNVADMHIFKKQVANLCKIKAMRKAPKKERETVL